MTFDLTACENSSLRVAYKSSIMIYRGTIEATVLLQTSKSHTSISGEPSLPEHSIFTFHMKVLWSTLMMKPNLV